jgi:hypothetical protein
MLRVVFAEFRKQAHYAECHYAACRYAERLGAIYRQLLDNTGTA